MNLQQFRAAVAGMTDDEQSCGFYKRWQVMQRLTKVQLFSIMVELHAIQYPGITLGGRDKTLRQSKYWLARHLEFQMQRVYGG